MTLLLRSKSYETPLTSSVIVFNLIIGPHTTLQTGSNQTMALIETNDASWSPMSKRWISWFLEISRMAYKASL
jgi:hypothetical protein